MRKAISNAPVSWFFLVASCVFTAASAFAFLSNHITGSTGAVACLAMAIVAAVCAGVEIRDSYHKNCELRDQEDNE